MPLLLIPVNLDPELERALELLEHDFYQLGPPGEVWGAKVNPTLIGIWGPREIRTVMRWRPLGPDSNRPEKEGPRFRYSCTLHPDPRETFAIRALAAARALFDGQSRSSATRSADREDYHPRLRKVTRAI